MNPYHDNYGLQELDEFLAPVPSYLVKKVFATFGDLKVDNGEACTKEPAYHPYQYGRDEHEDVHINTLINLNKKS